MIWTYHFWVDLGPYLCQLVWCGHITFGLTLAHTCLLFIIYCSVSSNILMPATLIFLISWENISIMLIRFLILVNLSIANDNNSRFLLDEAYPSMEQQNSIMAQVFGEICLLFCCCMMSVSVSVSKVFLIMFTQ